ncbi:MAG: hypothetical protein ACRYFX_12225 [Janthinobacterium lividum]
MPASTSIGQRFVQLIQHLGLSKNAFALSLDRTATVIQHLVEERNEPGFKLLCKVFEVYPNVSKDWLMLGEGEMLTTAVATTEPLLEPIDLTELTAPLRRPRPNGTHLQPADIAATLALAAPHPAPAEAPAAPKVAPPATQPVPAAPVAASSPPAPVAVPTPPDANYLAVLLQTQQLQHQLALAEQRNQHLLAQQALMQQLVDVLRAA